MKDNNIKKSPQRGEAGADSGKSKTENAGLSASQNNFNTNQALNSSNRTILTEVGGFTPAIDSIRDELGIIAAIVFGVIWRYCQMEDGKCTASQSKLAERSGYSLRTITTYTKKLVKAGYLRSSTTPGVGVTYYDTGKAGIKMVASAYDNTVDTQDTKADLSSKCVGNKKPAQQMPSNLRSKCVQPTQLMRTKKVLKKDLKDTSSCENANNNLSNNNDDDSFNHSSTDNSLVHGNSEHTPKLELTNSKKELIDGINDQYSRLFGYKLEVENSGAKKLLEAIRTHGINESDIKRGIVDYKERGKSPLNDIGSLTPWIVNARGKPAPRTRTYIGPNGEKKEVIIDDNYKPKPRTRTYTYPDGSTEEVVIDG